jgi:hypothetical protein
MADEKTTEPEWMRYLDFNLRFAHYDSTDGSYQVWVEGEVPGGAMSPNDAVTCTYDPKLFWKDPVLGNGGPLGKLDRRALPEKGLFELGKLLGDLALPPVAVRSLFDKSLAALKEGEGLRLRLRIDAPELTQLPWEFMHISRTAGEPQPADFLALRREISIVRTDTVDSTARPLPDPIPRIVGVLARPEDQDRLNVDQDMVALDTAVKAFNQAAGRELIQVVWVEKPASRVSLVEALKDGADVFQFSGHATFELGQEGKLVLENEDYESDFYPAAQLAQLLGNSGVRLAMLSACESGRRNGQVVWSGVAPALTREKTPAVVANQFDIQDTSAILLASRMYPRLLTGYAVDEALFEARQAIYQTQGLENRDWGVPVLYLHDETGILFPRTEEDVAGGPSQNLFVHAVRTIDNVSGEDIGIKIENMRAGRIDLTEHVGDVEKGGKKVGVEIENMG